jgi:hypothetical protein
MLVPCALRAPAPVNSGVRLLANTSHSYSLGIMILINVSRRWQKLYDWLWQSISVGVFLLGLAAFLLSLLFAAETYLFLKTAVPIEGKIVEYASGASVWYPIIEFTDDQGNVLRFTSNTGVRGSKRQVGRIVSVLYDPMDSTPTRAARVSDRVWLAPVTPGMIGILLIGMSLWWMRPERPKTENSSSARGARSTFVDTRT